jgi:hypothetical protein
MATAPLSNLTALWNAAGTTFTAIKMNATDTASAAGSLIIDLQVGGVSQFNVTKAGAVTAVGVAIPTISSTSTLTNKTLSSPTITGTVAGTFGFSGVLSFSTYSTFIWPTGNSSGRITGIYDRTGAFHDEFILSDNYNYNTSTIDSTALGTAAIIISAQAAAPGKIAFTTGAVNTAPTERLSIDPTGLVFADAINITLNTTTGTKIGTATSQKLGFFNQTPVVQPTAVADATTAVDVITQFNALLTRMRNLGLIAT